MMIVMMKYSLMMPFTRLNTARTREGITRFQNQHPRGIKRFQNRRFPAEEAERVTQ